MKDLHYPLCWRELSEDNIVILISHPNGTSSWNDKRDQERRAMTRTFVTWFRKMFPDVLTEFRPTQGGYYARWDAKRHFAAYGVTRKQFMLIKLAWTYTGQEITFKANSIHAPEYDATKIHMNDWATVPSEALLKRLETKRLKEEAEAAEKLSTAVATDS